MALLDNLLDGGRSAREGAALLLAVTDASRQPALYSEGRLADTMEERLESLTLHASLALVRLQREPALKRRAAAFTDQLFRNIDAGLREAGVGDLSVPRRMRAIASQFYGRLGVYAAALEANDEAALAQALARNTTAPAFAPALAAYARDVAQTQAGQGADALSTEAGWPPAPG